MLGFQPPLFPWTEEPSEVPAVDHWFRVSECGTRLMSTYSRQCVDIRTSPTPDVPPPLVYRPGDKVWLSTRYLRLRLPCKKLSPRYIGPFTIQRQINEVTYRLTLPAQYHVHPAFHVSLLKPFSPPATGPMESDVPPPPEIIEEPTIYQVREILDSQRRGGHLEYLIDWEGYGPEERSWDRSG